MNSTMPLALLLLVLLAGMLFFLVRAEGGVEHTLLCDLAWVKQQSLCASEKAGDTSYQDDTDPVLEQSRFNQGSCQADSDCIVAGCSSEVCADRDVADDLLTTCEFREDFPSERTHICGCVAGACSWSVR